MKRHFFRYIAALVVTLCLFVSGNLHAEPLDNWHWKNPLPQGNTLRSAVQVAGKYVAVGDYGTILTSADGSAWNKWTFLNGGSPSATANLKAIAHDATNSRYVAVGDNATIISSADGQTWTQVPTTATTDLVGIAYSDSFNCFLALGYDGTIIRLTWSVPQNQYLAVSTSLLAGGLQKNFATISFGAGRFIAAGYHGAIFSSADGGVSWTEVDVASQIPTVNTIKSSCFDDTTGFEKFVLLAEDGAIFTTSNGTTLIPKPSPGTGVFNSVSCSGGKYLVAGNYNAVATFDQKNVLNVIDDAGGQITGATLTGLSPNNSDNGLLYWNMANIKAKTQFSVYKSPAKTPLDLVAEGQVDTDTGGEITLTAKNNSGLSGTITIIINPVADTDAANKMSLKSSYIYYSTDLTVWTPATTVQGTSSHIYAGVKGFAANDFFLFGEGGQILKTTDDGVSWKASGSTDNLNKALLHGVAYHNNEFYAMGGSDLLDTIYKIGSQTLISTSGTKPYFSAGFTGANNTFFAAGNRGISSTNDNGVTWSTVSGPSGLNGITFGMDRVVAVGTSGASTSFDNGSTWPGSAAGYFNAVTFGNNTFVAVGKDTTSAGLIKTSTDGSNWTSRSSNTINWLKGVAYGNGTFVAAGLSGTVLTSKDAITWTPVAVKTTAELRSIAFGNGYFVAVGEEAGRGIIFTSSDSGNTWIARPSWSENGFYGVTYGNNIFYSVGASGTILHSDPVYDPAPVTVISTSPGNNATNVSPDLTAVTATFSLGMDASTITAANFTLQNLADLTLMPSQILLPDLRG